VAPPGRRATNTESSNGERPGLAIGRNTTAQSIVPADPSLATRDEIYAEWLRALREDREIPDQLRAAAEPLDTVGRELERLTKALDARDARLQDLFRRVHAAKAGADLSEVLDHIFDAFQAVIPLDRLSLAFLTDDGRHLCAHWVRSELGPTEIGPGYVQPLAGSTLEALLKSDEPRIISDLEAYLAEKPESSATSRIVLEGGRSSLSCPLHVEGRPIGVLFFTSRRRYAYTGMHKAMFQIVADEVAAVVERGRNAEIRSADAAARSALIDALPAHVALLDGEGNVLEVNDAWRDFGRANHYVGNDLGEGRNYLTVCDHADGSNTADARIAARGIRDVLNGKIQTFDQEYPCHGPQTERWFRLMVNRVDPAIEGEPRARAVVMHIDVTERVLAQRELARTANQDRLTGVRSRHGFAEALRERLDGETAHPASMVIMLDVANLTQLNDVNGYTAGDHVLIELARRLEAVAGERGLVGRVGGDKFVVFVPVDRAAGPAACRNRIDGVFTRPFDVGGLSVEMGAKFGYTRIGRSPRGPESLMREAEIAMAQSRNDPGRPWQQYTSELDRALHARVQLTHELNEAVNNNEFQLHYQPKVDLNSGRVLACEALLRWVHPARGLVSPAEFMPVAEQSQLIGPIGDWVLDEACRCLRAWKDAGLSVVRVAVNVSVAQLSMGGFPERVRAAFADHGLDPGALTLEITENVFEKCSQRLQTELRELHAMGVRLSLDDFGTGYSSLLYLQQYPFDEIKVDKGFVQHMLADPYSHEIVATVVGVAGALGADVVAEGVETPRERDALIAMGCRIAQGFHYSMPLAEEDFRWLLETHSTLPLTAHP